jgi:hypothetical protein
MSPARVKDVPRESLEEGLHFAGFVVISCPLKPDSKSVIKEILNASHQVTTNECRAAYQGGYKMAGCRVLTQTMRSPNLVTFAGEKIMMLSIAPGT